MSSRARILIADNDTHFLNATADCLEAVGYEVLTALTAEAARTLLESADIHLAILDIRLASDCEHADMTGLTLAQECAPCVPKIVWSAFPSWDLVRAALAPRVTGEPPAAAFLSKMEGFDVLLENVRRLLKTHR